MITIKQPAYSAIVDRLRVEVYENRKAMGSSAARDVAAAIRRLLQQQQEVRIVFAAAPSQNEFLADLRAMEDIDWSRVTAFHMDEYIGLSEDAPQKFGVFLRTRLFDAVRPGQVHLFNSSNPAHEECTRYAGLIEAAPIDIVCLGIGENGHIAFNDPPVADFNDPHTVKAVELDQACRRQQVNDGCFDTLEAVPTEALTLTVPALCSGAHLFCIVPGSAKSQAVHRTLNGPISVECPSTILRQHPDCTLYLDPASFSGCPDMKRECT